MKTSLPFLALFTFAIAAPAQQWPTQTNTAALSATIGWSASASPNITNYSLWQTTQSNIFQLPAPPTNGSAIGYSAGTNTTCTVTNLAWGTAYYFAVTCTGADSATSPFSPPVAYSTALIPLPSSSTFVISTTISNTVAAP